MLISLMRFTKKSSTPERKVHYVEVCLRDAYTAYGLIKCILLSVVSLYSLILLYFAHITESKLLK